MRLFLNILCGVIIGFFVTLEVWGDTGSISSLRASNILLSGGEWALKVAMYDPSSGANVIGEVDEAPTENTVLERLLAIETAVTALSVTVPEDGTHSDGVGLYMSGAIRRDTTPSSSCGAAGDNCAVNVDANGRLYTQAAIYDTSGVAVEFASESATPVVALDNDETEDEISDTAGCLAALFVGNRDTTPVFVKVFLVDADDVTVGMTVPNMVFMVPSNSTDGVAGNVMPPGVCISFTTGLSIATVTDEADAASTGPGANEVVLTAFIKS